MARTTGTRRETSPTDFADVIDSDDAQARKVELQEARAEGDITDREGRELERLEAIERALMAREGDGVEFGDSVTIYPGDWEHWQRFAKQHAEEDGFCADDWPGNCVDWHKAAKELAADYQEIEVPGFASVRLRKD